MITITGRLIQVGNINTYDWNGRGIELEIDGETVGMLGLTIEQCQQFVSFIGNQVSICISLMNTPERGGLSCEGTSQPDDRGNRATEETGNDRPAAPVYSIGDPCPVCASGRIGQSGYNYRCANCGWLGPRIEQSPLENYIGSLGHTSTEK